ncbi:MAG: transglycosylase SLT domain-containing protein [Alphaproteobacteria bacterium]
MVKPSPATLLLALALATSTAPAMSALLSDNDRQIYHRAFVAAEREQWSRANAAASEAKSRLLAKVLTWMRLVQPRSGASFTEISTFLKRNPDWPMPTALTRRAEEAMGAAESSQAVLEWFSERSPLTPDGKMALARALLAADEEVEAISVLRGSWVADNFGAVQEKQFLGLYGRYLRQEDHNARLDRLLWDRQNEAAKRMMKRVDLGHQRLALARIALIDMDGGSEGALRKVPAELAGNPGLLYDRARWRRKKERFDEAISIVNGPAGNKVRPDLWWAERAILARESLQRGNISKAYDLARGHGKINGASLVDAEWLAGWIALRSLHDKSTAFTHFKRAYEAATTPLSRSRGAYWAGRAAQALGNAPEAEKWYQKAAQFVTAFYGQLAAGQLEGGGVQALPGDPVPTREDNEIFGRSEIAQAATMLTEIGEHDQARHFIIRLVEISKSPGIHSLAARLAARSGKVDFGVSLARRSAQQGIFLISTGFPLIHVPSQDTPEKPLVLAVIRQESNFQKEAVSVAGAKGLMQLLPGTARQIAKAHKMKFTAASLTSDPNYNITLGRAYLEELLDSFGGSYILSIAAYNAGPSRVRQWTRELGDPRESIESAIDWIESIPFSETRNYVQRVLEGTQVYRRRLGEKKQISPLERDLRR